MSELGVSEVLARAEKELENLRRKISEGKDLKRDEAVLALVSALVPYIGRGFADVSSGVETLRGDVKELSSSVDKLLAEYSRKGEEQLQAVKRLADEFSREGQRAIASLEERLRQLKKIRGGTLQHGKADTGPRDAGGTGEKVAGGVRVVAEVA